jgi:hypothetical protein
VLRLALCTLSQTRDEESENRDLRDGLFIVAGIDLAKLVVKGFEFGGGFHSAISSSSRGLFRSTEETVSRLWIHDKGLGAQLLRTSVQNSTRSKAE